MPLVTWEVWIGEFLVAKISNHSALEGDWRIGWTSFGSEKLLTVSSRAYESPQRAHQFIADRLFPASCKDEVKLWRIENGIRSCDGVAIVELKKVNFNAVN